MNLPALAIATAAAAHWMGAASASLHPVRFESACQALACWAFTIAIDTTKGDS